MDIHAGAVPKQAKSILAGEGKVEAYEATGGTVTAQFAAHNLSYPTHFCWRDHPR